MKREIEAFASRIRIWRAARRRCSSLRLYRHGAVGDDDMKTLRSTPAQIVTAAAATIALLYFFRGILAPFFVAIVLVVVIHAIADVIVGLCAKAPRWIVMIPTGILLSAVIIISFDVVLHGLSNRIQSRSPFASNIDPLG